ncbi:MCM DNA helicase complex subunit [Nowakowskiella sp. JEL0407]|nr:MCM DNA helicase complex subunit [Nowakowskiella sp. JEL0407]
MAEVYRKNIGFVGGLSLLISSISGPGMVVIPQIFQESGWLFPTISFIVIATLTALGSLFLVESLTNFPGNEKFQRNVEFAVLVHQFYGKKWYYLTHVVVYGSLQSLNLASIILAIQQFDNVLVLVFGSSCGFSLSRGSFVCSNIDSGNSPFDGQFMLFTFGYLIFLALVTPLSMLELNDNMLIQFSTYSYHRGAHSELLPAVGKKHSNVVGNILFNYAFVATIPSWLNTKHKSVPIRKSLIMSLIWSTVLYILMGFLGAVTYPVEHSSNILATVSHLTTVAGVPETIAVTSIFFSVAVLLSSIPVYIIIMRLNLTTSKLCTKGWANFWAGIFPFLIVIPFLTGNWLQQVVNWTSLIFQSATNFIAPFLIYLFLDKRNTIIQQSVLDELDLMDVDAGVKKRGTDDDDFDYAYHLPHARPENIVVHKDPIAQIAEHKTTNDKPTFMQSTSQISNMTSTSTRQNRKNLLGANLGALQPVNRSARQSISANKSYLGSKMALNVQNSSVSRFALNDSNTQSRRQSDFIHVPGLNEMKNESRMRQSSTYTYPSKVPSSEILRFDIPQESTFKALPPSITKYVPARWVAIVSFVLIVFAVMAALTTTGIDAARPQYIVRRIIKNTHIAKLRLICLVTQQNKPPRKLISKLKMGDELRNLNADELLNERTRFFGEFLNSDYGANEYRSQITKMLSEGNRRLIVNLNHLRTFSAETVNGLLNSPAEFLPAFDKALKEHVLVYQRENALKFTRKLDDLDFYVAFDGSFGDNFINPRDLSSLHLGKLLCIEGIVTRCSLVRPKIVKSVHYAEATNQFHERYYSDGLSLGQLVPSGTTYPKQDAEGNLLTTEYGLCSYRDYQTISLQEMPERAPAGSLPRPIEVIMDDDLVDKVKPGDRVQLVGVYRSVGKKGSENSATFRTLVLGRNVRLLAKEIQMPTISEQDIQEIRKIGKRKDVFELLSSSLAPSIYGHDFIKKSVLLLLLGGIEKNLTNGTHIRGDINMLLIGDPSTAKSQILRFVLNIAPLAIATTGRGSSGVGLTAAVTHDKETGERRLEAGAMVLGDRGVVCIDEFDKMSDVDRVAIHEVMEQQTVTIAKAGIHTSLNARCSVIAAANPAQGQYIDHKKPFQNIHLPDSLLSRFDLLFIVKDNLEEEFNRNISEHILRLHRFTPPGVEEGAPISDDALARPVGLSMGSDVDAEDPNRSTVYEKYNKLLHIGIAPVKNKGRGRKKTDDVRVELLSLNFMKKYIHYAKSRIKPVLTDEASEYISDLYTELRSQADGDQRRYRTVPITPRTLETLIRLSTAHAKARLSPRVEQIDCEVIAEILKFALFEELMTKPRTTKKRKVKEGEEEESDEEEDENEDSQDPAERFQRPKFDLETPHTDIFIYSKMKKIDNAMATMDIAEDPPSQDLMSQIIESQNDEMMVDDDNMTQWSLTGVQQPLDANRQQLNALKGRLANETGEDVESIMVGDIVSRISQNLRGSEKFDADEVLQAIREMNDENQIFYHEEEGRVIFL